MGRRVSSFGIGKVLIRIRMDELPEDIREGLCELFENSNRINRETVSLIIAGDVVAEKDLSKI